MFTKHVQKPIQTQPTWSQTQTPLRRGKGVEFPQRYMYKNVVLHLPELPFCYGGGQGSRLDTGVIHMINYTRPPPSCKQSQSGEQKGLTARLTRLQSPTNKPLACFSRSRLSTLVESNPALSHSCLGMTSSALATAAIISCSLPATVREQSLRYLLSSISIAPPPVLAPPQKSCQLINNITIKSIMHHISQLSDHMLIMSIKLYQPFGYDWPKSEIRWQWNLVKGS